MCMQQQNIPVTALSKDHTYHQQNSMQNSLTPQSTVHQPDCAESGNTCSVMSQSQGHIYTCSQQVESHSKEQNIQEETVWPDVPLCSTPLKTITNAREITYMEIDDEQDELINLSKLGNTFRDDSRDKTYEASESDCDSDLEQNITKCDLDLVSDKKYIVFNSCLQNLFVRLKCPECDSAVDPEDICTDETDNALLSCSIFCTSGHLVLKWASQPVLGKMAAGNLLTCAALLFSGQTYTHISQFASFLNLKFPTHTTFNRIQRENLMPVISYTWSTLQDELLKKVKESGKLLRLAGDGRCDSPGYSAKYCTYSLLDMDTDCIVSFVVVQVSETGSSCKMELEGFKRCMNYLIDLGFAIEVLATDRHVQIRSVMSKSYCDINHQFDVWHLANNVKKKLVQKAKAKGVEELAPWIKSISNHLWWCASNCNGDKNWLEECWKSVVHHISNIHEFDGDHLTRCPHEPLDPEVARKKRWLKIGSKAHNALKEVVLDKRLLKDIRQLSEFCHTGSLEVYHSLMTKYVPKRQEFDFDQMMARTALAVIDHNMSRNRPQATNKKGEKMFRVTYPKASSEWVAKPVYEAKTYDWIYAMLRRVVQEKETRTLSPVKVSRQGNIATKPVPPRSEVIQRLTSRFKKCT